MSFCRVFSFISSNITAPWSTFSLLSMWSLGCPNSFDKSMSYHFIRLENISRKSNIDMETIQLQIVHYFSNYKEKTLKPLEPEPFLDKQMKRKQRKGWGGGV